MALLDQLRQLGKDTVFYGVAGLLPRVATFLLIPVYTRYLSPAEYGLLTLAVMITTLLSPVLLLGQNASLVRFYRQSVDVEQPGDLGRLLYTVTVFTVALACLVVGIGFIVGPRLLPKLVSSSSFTFFPYVALAFGTAFVGIPLTLLQGINRAQRKVKIYTFLQLTAFAVTTSASLLLVVKAGRGATGALMGTLVGGLVVAPVALALLARDMTRQFSFRWLKASLAFGSPLIPHTLALWVLSFASRAFLERYSSLDQVGTFSLAFNLASGLSLIAAAVHDAWVPLYYEIASEGVGSTLRRLTTFVALVYSGLGVGFILFSPQVLTAVSPASYAGAADVISIVSAGLWALCLYLLFSTAMFYSRKTKFVPLVSGTAAVVNIALCAALVPRYGLSAAAWAMFISYAVMALGSSVFTQRLRYGDLEVGKLIRLALIVCAVLCLSLLADNLDMGRIVWVAKLALLVLALCAVFAARIVSWRDMRGAVALLGRRRNTPPDSPEQPLE